MLNDILNERRVPNLMKLSSGETVKTAADFELRRAELKQIFQEKVYGYIPEKPDKMTVDVEEKIPNFVAGKAKRRELTFNLTVGEKCGSFKAVSVIPVKEGKHPAFVFMNFSPDVPDKCYPTEEIVDEGFAVFSFYYSDATRDNNDFTSGIAPLFTDGERKGAAPGKIAMWAWCAMRVMDYIETLDNIDLDNVAVIGHSRLGKTALVAGGFDTRFKYVISNDSGCSGAAITRGKVGEGVDVITSVFPHWFCPNYVNNASNFMDDDYDQHFLLALTAPRYVLVGSAKEDEWADPASEFLSAYAASEAWKCFGKTGLICADEIPSAKTVLADGDVMYQVRYGTHYLSREDWGEYIKFIKSKM